MKNSKDKLNKFALVIPFCDKDKNQLKFTLNLWEINGHHILDNIHNKLDIDLVIYYATSNNDDNLINKTKDEIMYLTKKYDQYFNKILFETIVIDKKNDYHPKAPCIMFFNFLFNNNYEVFFYCEADCIPIKNNWLLYLYSELEECLDKNIWIKGSMYRGEKNLFGDIPRKKHINGNAIFNVSDTKALEIFKKMSNIVMKKQGAYDVEMMIYFYRIKNTEDGKLIFQNIRYTDFILNFGKQKIPNKILIEPPVDTYFIHGKQYLKFNMENYKTTILNISDDQPLFC